MVAEDLVAAFGPGVVVAVALEVEQEDIGEEVVGVPAVFRAGAFVAAVFELATVEAVVFEVVDDFQQVEGDEALAEEEHGAEPAKGDGEGREGQRGDAVPPDEFVAPAEGVMAFFLEAFGFQFPGVDEVAGIGLGQEVVEGLVVARGRGVFRGGDVHVVAAQVFDFEAGVADQ